MNRAFFLDRDGTINRDLFYIGDPADVELLPGAAEAIRMMNQSGYLVIVISNQSGIARGYFDTSAVEQVNERLNTLLREQGAHIDKFYYCPHLKEGAVLKYALDCECRKPKPGLYRRAIADFSLNPKQCGGCGDRVRDIQALPKLGVPMDRLGILDGQSLPGHYPDILAYTRSVLGLS